jgi:hypothetical protein
VPAVAQLLLHRLVRQRADGDARRQRDGLRPVGRAEGPLVAALPHLLVELAHRDRAGAVGVEGVEDRANVLAREDGAQPERLDRTAELGSGDLAREVLVPLAEQVHHAGVRGAERLAERVPDLLDVCKLLHRRRRAALPPGRA